MPLELTHVEQQRGQWPVQLMRNCRPGFIYRPYLRRRKPDSFKIAVVRRAGLDPPRKMRITGFCCDITVIRRKYPLGMVNLARGEALKFHGVLKGTSLVPTPELTPVST